MAEPQVPPSLQRAASYAWRLLIVAVAVLATVYVLLELKVVVLPVIVALFLATVLVPPTQWLEGRGAPKTLAALAAMLLLLGTIGLVGATVGRQVGQEFDELGEQVTEGVRELEELAAGEPFNLDRGDLERLVKQVQSQSGGAGIGSRVARGATLAVETVTGILLLLVLLFFFLKDREELTGWMLRKVRPRHRDDARALALRGWNVLRGYVRGTAIIALVDATIIGIGLLVIGVPLVPALALLTFLGAFLPLVGAVLAGLVAALVALVSGGPADAVLVLGLIVVVQEVEGDVLAPLVLGRAVRLHPVVVLLSLATGAVAVGVIGAFLAVPLTAVGAGMANEWRVRHPLDDEEP